MRQYVSERPFDRDGLLTVEGKDFRYFRSVLRMRVGDMLRVRHGGGEAVDATVCAIDERGKKIVLQRCAVQGAALPLGGSQSCYAARTELWLLMFVPKAGKAELIVRQAAECGVLKIVPVRSEFSAPGAERIDFKSGRFARIIREARQQSGSPVPTEVAECVTLGEAVASWKEACAGVGDATFSCALYERNESSRTMRQAFLARGGGAVKKACVACGSEGGISPGEISLLRGSGFEIIHFDTNILRCETACLYGLAVLQAELSELSGRA